MVNGKIIRICLLLSIIARIFAPADGIAEERVAAVGDSITAGWPYLQSDGNGCRCPSAGFEVQLEAKLDASGRASTVYNYGNPGDTTLGMLKRIDQVLQAVNPDVVLLLGGTNDAGPYVSPAAVAANLAAMVDKVRAHNSEPVIGTLTPDNRPYFSFKDIPTYNQYIKNMANGRNVRIADHYSAVVGTWPSLTADGLHPNSSGYNKLAQTWFNAFPPKDIVNPPDPNKIDNDQDGYTENQGDCNDADPSIHPLAIDACGDGIDQNCDGKDEQCPNIMPILMLLLH